MKLKGYIKLNYEKRSKCNVDDSLLADEIRNWNGYKKFVDSYFEILITSGSDLQTILPSIT
jgi:hypothetical protein